jgi:exopolysaccharide biosynthesis operon protein EpsL
MPQNLVDGEVSACVEREERLRVRGRTPLHRGSVTQKSEDPLKKHLSIRPVLATLCALPLAVHSQGAQPTGPAQAAQPSATSQPSTPSTPSVPEGALWQGTPSQAPGVPYPSGIFYRDGGFAPAGTQASTVTEEVGPSLQFRALAGIEHESNVTRVNTGEISDTAGILGVGVRFDRRYGLQRLRADLEANTYKYTDDSSLDYNIFNYALAWDWSLTPRFHGVLGANQQQYRDVQLDPVTLANRVGRRSDRTEFVEGVYELGAAWRVLGGLSHTRSKSELPNSWDGNPDITNFRVGAGYEWPSGTSLYGRVRHGKGSYEDPTASVNGDFDENEVDVVLKWPVSGKTALDARLGHIDRKHDTDTQRDFSGVVGAAVVSWAITGKTSLAAGVSRDLSSTGDRLGGSVVSDRVFIGPVWRVTPLVAVNLRYDHVRRDWEDVPAASINAGRHESANILSAAVEWQPLRWMAVSGYVRGERQSSNANTDYRNTTVGAAVKAFF